MTAKLILGSSSRYRRELLERFGIPFSQSSPDIDESRREGESPDILVTRLAREKADAVARQHPDAWILASDQLATLDGDVIGKPGTRERAAAQLRRASGRTVRFLTSVCLQHRERRLEALDRTEVRFRDLADDEIDRYLEREHALDCAGSFRAEGLGITLFEALASEDPTAIVGLPLITVAALLREAGFRAP